MVQSVQLMHCAESGGRLRTRGGGADGHIFVAQGRAHQEVGKGFLRALVLRILVHSHLVALVQLELLRREAGSLDLHFHLHVHRDHRCSLGVGVCAAAGGGGV